MDPLWFKLFHILGATVLFGTGLGTAFQMWRAHRSGDVTTIARTARSVVLADWIFTAPAVVAQPVTGLLLAHAVGYDLRAGWIMAATGLFVLAGVCWLPVVWLQYRMAAEAERAASGGQPLPPAYHRSARAWFWLGWPAFLSVLGIFYLMVFKPEI